MDPVPPHANLNQNVGENKTSTDHNAQHDDFLAELFGTGTVSQSPLPMTKAPVVGPHHRQSHSLVGFDPLLNTPNVEPSTTATGTVIDPHPLSAPAAGGEQGNKSDIVKQNPFLAMPVSPPLTPPPKGSKRLPFMKRRAEHRKSKSLSGPMILSPPTKSVDGNKTEASSNTEKRVSLSPPRPEHKKTFSSIPKAPAEGHKSTPTTPQGNRGGGLRAPWSRHKGHRKTQSVSSVAFATTAAAPASPPSLQQHVSLSASNSPMTTNLDQISTMSPMIQELFSIEQEAAKAAEQQPSLFVPSLSKPRPTSFLTGQEEVVRSSEQDPTAWQLDIPTHADTLTCTRLCQFLETYRSEECLLDLQQLVGFSRMQLSSFARGDSKLFVPNTTTEIAACHRKIVESLLECGKDVAEVKGFFTAPPQDAHGNPDHRREVLVVERQNKFLCIFRGTTPEQQGKFARQPETCELKAGPNPKVFVDRYSAFAELQAETFQLLDKLSEDNPFCDITFTGTMFGASMATLAAYVYAITRTSLRVSCIVSASPKCGPSEDFRWAVHSTPNLNVNRLEVLAPGRGRAADHVGHSLRLSPPTKDNKKPTVQLLKFGGDEHQENPHPLSFLPSKPKEKDVREFVLLLEDLDGQSWVKDYYLEDGAGVRGKDNEARQMA